MARIRVLLLMLAAAGGCRKSEPPAPSGAPAVPASAPASAPPAAAPAPDAIRLLLVYGSEKKSWLEEQVAAFAATGPRADGRPIRVETRAMGSGEAVQAVLSGELKPHVVSPASGAYLTLLNDAWKERTGRDKALSP